MPIGQKFMIFQIYTSGIVLTRIKMQFHKASRQIVRKRNMFQQNIAFKKLKMVYLLVFA